MWSIAVHGEVPVGRVIHAADFLLFPVVTPAVRQKCYEAFKEAYGSDMYEILDSYRDVQITRNGRQQTSGQRKKEFKKAEAKLVKFVSGAIAFPFGSHV